MTIEQEVARSIQDGVAYGHYAVVKTLADLLPAETQSFSFHGNLIVERMPIPEPSMTGKTGHLAATVSTTNPIGSPIKGNLFYGQAAIKNPTPLAGRLLPGGTDSHRTIKLSDTVNADTGWVELRPRSDSTGVPKLEPLVQAPYARLTSQIDEEDILADMGLSIGYYKIIEWNVMSGGPATLSLTEAKTTSGTESRLTLTQFGADFSQVENGDIVRLIRRSTYPATGDSAKGHGTLYRVIESKYSGLELAPRPLKKDEDGLYKTDSDFKAEKFFGFFNYEIIKTRRDVVALRGSKKNFGLMRSSAQVASGSTSQLLGSEWVQLGLRVGDSIVFSTGSTHKIISLGEEGVSFGSPVSGQQGATWTAHRQSDWVHIHFSAEKSYVGLVRDVINSDLIELEPDVYRSVEKNNSAPYEKTGESFRSSKEFTPVGSYWSRDGVDVIISRATWGSLRSFILVDPSGSLGSLQPGDVVSLLSYSGIESTSDEGLALRGYYRVASANQSSVRLSPLRHEKTGSALIPKDWAYKTLNDVFSVEAFRYKAYFPWQGVFEGRFSGDEAHINPRFLVGSGESPVSAEFSETQVASPLDSVSRSRIPGDYIDSYDVFIYRGLGVKFCFTPESGVGGLQPGDYLVPTNYQRKSIVKVDEVVDGKVVILEQRFYDSLDGRPAIFPLDKYPSFGVNKTTTYSSVKYSPGFSSISLNISDQLSGVVTGDRILLEPLGEVSPVTANLFNNWFVVLGVSGSSISLDPTTLRSGSMLGETLLEDTYGPSTSTVNFASAIGMPVRIRRVLHVPSGISKIWMEVPHLNMAEPLIFGPDAISGRSVRGHVFKMRNTETGSEFQLAAEKYEPQGAYAHQITFFKNPVIGSNGNYTVSENPFSSVEGENWEEVGGTPSTSLGVGLKGFLPNPSKRRLGEIRDEFVRQINAAPSGRKTAALDPQILSLFCSGDGPTVVKSLRQAIQEIKLAVGEEVITTAITINPVDGFKKEGSTASEYSLSDLIEKLGQSRFSPATFSPSLYDLILDADLHPIIQVYFNIGMAEALAKTTLQNKKNVYVDAYLQVTGYEDAISFLEAQKLDLMARVASSEDQVIQNAVNEILKKIDLMTAAKSVAQNLKEVARTAIVDIKERPDLMALIDNQLLVLTDLTSNFLKKNTLGHKRVFVERDGPFNPEYLQVFFNLVSSLENTNSQFYMGFKKKKLSGLSGVMRPGVEPSVRRSASAELIETEKEPTLKNKQRRLVRARNQARHGAGQLGDLRRHYDSAVNPAMKRSLADAIGRLFPRVQKFEQAANVIQAQIDKVKGMIPPLPSLPLPPLDGVKLAMAVADAIPVEPRVDGVVNAESASYASVDDGAAQATLVEKGTGEASSEPASRISGSISNLFTNDINDFKATNIVIPFSIQNQASGRNNKGQLSYISIVDGETHEEQNFELQIGDLSFNSSQYNQFMLTSIQESYQEKVQVMDTLGSGWSAFFFGSHPEVWSVSGLLINDLASDHVTKFRALWDEYLRGTSLAREKRKMKIHIPAAGLSILGFGISLSLSTDSQQNEVLVPFTMQFLVAGHPEPIPMITSFKSNQNVAKLRNAIEWASGGAIGGTLAQAVEANARTKPKGPGIGATGNPVPPKPDAGTAPTQEPPKPHTPADGVKQVTPPKPAKPAPSAPVTTAPAVDKPAASNTPTRARTPKPRVTPATPLAPSERAGSGSASTQKKAARPKAAPQSHEEAVNSLANIPATIGPRREMWFDRNIYIKWNGWGNRPDFYINNLQVDRP